MTIGIGVTLPDGALLVADGRRTWPLANGRPPMDDIDKIEQVHSTVYAIPFGIIQATDCALVYLRERFTASSTLKGFASLLDESVNKGWTYLISNLDKSIDPNQRFMRAALITGGIVANQPFIAGCLYGSGIDPSLALHEGLAYQVFMLGGEEQHAIERFTEASGRSIPSSWQAKAGPVNTTVKALLGSAESTIRAVSSQNSEIGGAVRYAVIRSGFPVEKAIWSV